MWTIDLFSKLVSWKISLGSALHWAVLPVGWGCGAAGAAVPSSGLVEVPTGGIPSAMAWGILHAPLLDIHRGHEPVTAASSHSGCLVQNIMVLIWSIHRTATMAPAGTVKRGIGHGRLPDSYTTLFYIFWERHGHILQGCWVLPVWSWFPFPFDPWGN